MSVTDKVFAETFGNSLEVLAIVQALAARAGFICLNDLCLEDADIVARYIDTVKLAIRALKKLERKQRVSSAKRTAPEEKLPPNPDP
jgi:hypothetical protein